MTSNEKRKNPSAAMWLSIIPGLGQFYNGQLSKAIVLFILFVLEVIEIVTFGIKSLVGLCTLGTVPMQDHSLFMLIKGSMQIIILALFIIYHLICMRDAFVVAKILIWA